MADEAGVLRRLDNAVAEALQRGIPCTGWVLQSGGDHVAAWLYLEDDATGDHVSLMETIEVYPTASDAADACLIAARRLRVSGD